MSEHCLEQLNQIQVSSQAHRIEYGFGRDVSLGRTLVENAQRITDAAFGEPRNLQRSSIIQLELFTSGDFTEIRRKTVRRDSTEAVPLAA